MRLVLQCLTARRRASATMADVNADPDTIPTEVGDDAEPAEDPASVGPGRVRQR